MNHGAISVIYLALSAVCLIGLYGVYKPQINASAGQVFGHVERVVDQGFANAKGNPQGKQKGQSVLDDKTKLDNFSWNGIQCKADHDGQKGCTVEIIGGTPINKGAFSWGLTDKPQPIQNAIHIHFDNGSMSNATDMSGMFMICKNLQSVTGNPDTHNVTDMDGMFGSDSNLRDVSALGSWDTSNVTNMDGMFLDDSRLQNLPQGQFTTKSASYRDDILGMLHGVPDSVANTFKSKVPSSYWNNEPYGVFD